MKVLVVGGGGREHAIAWKISKSPLVTELYCAPGNPGTAGFATNVEVTADNLGSLAVWAAEHRIDLTVVGPEAPLADGLVDVFEEHGLRVFGPTAAAAQLEASKSFAKDVMLKAGVPTPAGEVFDDYEQAKAYVEANRGSIVVKADGLAAGKGVVVAKDTDEALAALHSFMKDGSLGDSGQRVVIEECIDGKEASVMAIIDGDVVVPLVVSQDYKRLLDNDEGPNTGGMGAISPTPVLDDSRVEKLTGEIFLPVVRELKSRGIAFRGFLYAGAIIDSSGVVRVLEFNVRLGDPETQVLLVRMKSDLLEVLSNAVSGKLVGTDIQWHADAAATVVAASAGYPGTCDDGKEISGLFEEEDDVIVFQAGTREENGAILSKGGRVLAVSARGDTVNNALSKAYAGLERISFEGKQFRKDIGGGAW